MSLKHFLGLSYEIKLIDFLMCSIDIEYDIEELSDFTGIDEPTIKYFLPRLEYNGIIVVNGDKIQIARNDITEALLSAVYANSGLIASYHDGVDENNFKKGMQ
jgi:DNA-binding MarR family transcriptional regulator